MGQEHACKGHKDCPRENPMDQGKRMDSWDRNMQGTQKTIHGTIPWIKGRGWIGGTGTCKGHKDCPRDNPMDQGKGMDRWDRNMQGTQGLSKGQSHGSREEDG